MNGNLIRKSDNSKNFTVKFFNNTTETKSVTFLWFYSDCILNHSDTPLFSDYMAVFVKLHFQSKV
ncbi:MAG: hypothetical protein DDT26_02274 [Dehalococcoidia bacterium]|nr:hypothetical protein [Chloroflexota bacterium]